MSLSKISITLSIIGIIIALIIQSYLYQGYLNASGKTQALYGLKHLAYLKFAYVGIVAFIIAIISIFRKEKLKTILLGLFLSILSILITVLEIYKLFI